MSLKAKLEAVIYAAEEPVTLDQLASLLGDAVLAEMRAEQAAGASETRPSFFDGQQLSPDALTKEQKSARDKAVKGRLNRSLDELMADYASSDRGMEIRQVAGGYRMATKPEHHDVVVAFAKGLKPPVRLSLPALETLSVIAYKQPVTVPEISEIRGVDASGVIATLLDRKLITTAGRKQVIGRPILYKTTKEFLLRFGLNDVSELPSMEEFEKLGEPRAELFAAPASSPAEAQGEAAPASEALPATNDSSVAPESTISAGGAFAAEALTDDSSGKS
jgi:segregation and condensation protein B